MMDLIQLHVTNVFKKFSDGFEQPELEEEIVISYVN